MKDLLHTPTHRIQVPDGATIKKTSTLVSISAVGELMPSAVRTEVRGYALDGAISAGKREAASQIITRINSDEQIDAFGVELETLLERLVTHTALTQAESDAILAALQA